MEEAYGLGFATAAVYTEAEERAREREAWHMPPQQCVQRQKRDVERERLGICHRSSV
jgi:hypothetical protein